MQDIFKKFDGLSLRLLKNGMSLKTFNRYTLEKGYHIYFIKNFPKYD